MNKADRIRHNWIELTYCTTCDMEVLRFPEGEWCKCDDHIKELDEE